ncbi:MAG: endonuclease/exonuclease/phosphatase family protein [Clostridia bacterium]|nr:endonuclease/exonuclease/phosphatase family protein [Clostridia bacterium]
MNIKIMSYNTQHCLNFITREIDFDIITDTIKKCGADIIGLQEMRGEGDRADYTAQTETLAEKLGFNYYFAEAIRIGGTNPYGNAVLSRYPIISAETVPIPDPAVKKYDQNYETRCLMKAKIDVGGGINVLVSHFGLNPDEQENAVKTVVANLPKEKCVLMGDFNMQPDNENLAPIKQRLCDTAEKFDSPKLSFPSDIPRVKIDYIFVSSDLTVADADIPAIVSSDHRPHVATINI